MSVRRNLVLALFALALVSIGFAPFLVTLSHRVINDRVFYFSALGGALAVVSGLSLITLPIRARRLRTWVFIIAGSMVIMVAGGNASGELSILQELSDLQESLLLNIVRQAPRLTSGSTIVVFDPNDTFRNDFRRFGGSGNLMYALNYIYGKSDGSPQAFFCFLDGPSTLDNDTCTLKDDSIDMYANEQLQGEFAYNTIIAFMYQSDRAVLLDRIPADLLPDSSAAKDYNPEALIDTEAPVPERAQTFFSWKRQIYIPVPRSSFAMDFDIDSPNSVNLSGWRETEIGADGSSYRWSTSSDARLFVPLAPGSDYIIRFRILSFMTQALVDTAQLRIGDTLLPLKLERDAAGGFIYSADVPAYLINNSPPYTEFVFHSELAPVPNTNLMLGAAYDWLQIEPSTK